MDRPVLLPTNKQNETFTGITYHIDGELVPALVVEISQGHSVYFEHNVLLWKYPKISIGIKPLSGGFKPITAGVQILIIEAIGQGQIAFSREGAGHIFAIHLNQGQEMYVREHQFLAATQNIDYHFERIKAGSNVHSGSTGMFIDKFNSLKGDGILWLYGYGNVFEMNLSGNDQIDVEPGSWLYKDTTVKMETGTQRLSTGGLAGMNFMINRFTGPGRIGIQSMYLHMPSNE